MEYWKNIIKKRKYYKRDLTHTKTPFIPIINLRIKRECSPQNVVSSVIDASYHSRDITFHMQNLTKHEPLISRNFVITLFLPLRANQNPFHLTRNCLNYADFTLRRSPQSVHSYIHMYIPLKPTFESFPLRLTTNWQSGRTIWKLVPTKLTSLFRLLLNPTSAFSLFFFFCLCRCRSCLCSFARDSSTVNSPFLTKSIKSNLMLIANKD